jgi:ethanolamine transporter EutH
VTGARSRALLTAAGGLLALAVMAGNITIPIAVMAGWLR